MNQIYFLVKDIDELKDKVWDKFFDDIVSGIRVLRIQELEVNGSNKRLFKVWTEFPAIPYISYGTITASAVQTTPCWEDIKITC